MEKRILVGPIKIEGNKDEKASDLLRKAFVGAIEDIKLKMPFKADGFKAEKIPNQPDGTPIVIEPANIKQPKLEKVPDKIEKVEPKKTTKIKLKKK